MSDATSRSTRLHAVRGRLARVDGARVDAVETDARTIDDVFLRRARQLARPPSVGSDAGMRPILVVRVGQERYGFELSDLAEVFPYRGCTPVPGSPTALLGVINLRGDLMVVVDLCRLLALTSSETDAGYVIRMRRRGHELGFRVDTIEGIRRIDAAPTAAGADAERSGVAGSRVVKALVADAVLLLDIDAALASLGPHEPDRS